MLRFINIAIHMSYFILWIIIITAQFCVQQTFCSEAVNFVDADIDVEVPEDVEVFSSQEVTGPPTTENEEIYLPQIETIYIKTKIRFRYSRTRITSRIANPDKRKAQNVTYTLRIPNESFISRFEMIIDGDPKTYRASVVKAEDARKMLQFAVGEGRSVTLGMVEQSELDFNEVSLKFVLGANKRILFSLIYEERLPRIDNQYESVTYLVPDYMTNKTHFRVEVVIEENLKVTSIRVPLDDDEYSSHNATITREPSTKTNPNPKTTVSWSNFNTGEMRWKYPRSEFIVLYTLEDEISTGHILLRNGYFIHFFAPVDLEPLKKHVIFILDISDSMTGLKMNQTISAMRDILDELKLEDFFNIVTFSSEAHVWSCLHGSNRHKLYPFPANPDCKAEARRFIETIQPHGSTNMNDALVKGLEIAKNLSLLHSPTVTPHPKASSYRRGEYRGRTASWSEKVPSDVQSIIIFFTDGEPTSGIIDKRALLTTVKIMNYNLSVPIFSLAFGNSADFVFLSKLSSRNGAFARKIYENSEETSFQLANFYREISSPVLANLSFKYESHPSSSSGGIFPSLVNSGYNMAFQGQEILTLGKINGWPGVNNGTTGNLIMTNATVTGIGRSGSRKVFRIPIKDCSKAGSCGDEGDFDDKCVEKIFVYLTIKQRMQEIFLLESDRDNDDEGRLEAQRIKEKVTETALKNGLITMFTSMVMKTRSIREEEMDDNDVVLHPLISSTSTIPPPNINDHPDQETDVQVFLGSKISMPHEKRSKIFQEFDISSIRTELQSLPNPTTIRRDQFNITLKDLEKYNLFEVGNNATSRVNGTANVTISNSTNQNQTTDNMHFYHLL